MATKFYNNQARVFHKLLNGADFNELLKAEIEKINDEIREKQIYNSYYGH